jgi:PDDEXK-like domain of unknown function (DUF3799)
MDSKELFRQIRSGELILSHSSFNQFCKSPSHFVAYKLKEKKVTDAMRFGSMVHCLVLEPGEFDSRYAIAPECDKRTKKGKAIWGEFTETIKDGVEIVKHNDFTDAERIARNILRNDSSAWVFDQIGHTEVGIEWKYKSLNWRGFIDGIGDEQGIIVDLKILADASPRKVENYIKYEGVGRQAVHYLRGSRCPDYKYFIVAADRFGGVSVTNIGKGVLNICREEIDYYITQFKKCVFLEKWDSSFDFFQPAGINEMTAW